VCSWEKKYNAAENFKAVLESHGREGLKTKGKNAKKDTIRGINKGFRNITRKLKGKLSDTRCQTINGF